MSLFLVDGHALAYRSYYAFINRPLVNSKGEETSAVFGFTKAILSLLEKFDPSYIAVVFDSPEKNFRHELFPEYKANRKEMPESLVRQIDLIFAVTEAMAIPVFSTAGFEADDVIATLARRVEKDLPVKIVSGDKDLLQLVTDRIHIIRPGKGGLFEEEMDGEKLLEKTGLRPGQFVDFLALAGDSSDNVPGVRGVGEKTALKLIREFGTLENLYDNLDRVSSPSLRRKLVDGKESAMLSKRLVTLECNAPVEADIRDLARRDFKYDELRGLLDELEFTRILDNIKPSADNPGTNSTVDYRLITEEGELMELVLELSSAEEFALDVEASDLDPMRALLAGISMAHKPGQAWYVPVRSKIEDGDTLLSTHRYSPGLPIDIIAKHLSGVFANEGIKKVGQNIKYDAIVLSRAGLKLQGIAFDTMLASYCLDPARRSHSLDNLAADFLNHKMISFKDLFDSKSRKRDIREVSVDKVKDYACEDADMTLRLKNVFQDLLDASQVKDLFFKVEMPLSFVLTDMEMDGVSIDVPFLSNLSRELEAKLGELRSKIFQAAGEEFNVNSTQKLREILFVKLGLKPKRKTKTGYSTDVDVLTALADEHELPRLVLEYRMLTKLKSTYIDALPKLVNPSTGRVHTSYNQAVTSTGRLSSSNPNLQNIPIRTPLGREIRKAFIAGGEDWVLLDADYSQIELRILAHLSGDPALVKAFEMDEDVHRRTASMIMGIPPGDVSDLMRSRAKTVNFGIIYGMGARGLAQALNIDTKEAKEFIDEYFKCYPGVKRFVQESIASARRDKAARTLLGRVRQIPEIDSSDNRTRSFAERVAINTPVQGTAADIIKVAMVKIAERFKSAKMKAKMILQVHDELLFDLPREELDQARAIVIDVMENAIKLKVPLKVDMGTGKNWLEAH